MTTVTADTYRELLNLSNRLADAKIAYHLHHSRADSITVLVDVPGAKWEVDFVDYGDEVHVEVEVFRGGGVTGDETSSEALIAHQIAADEADSP